MDPTELIKAAPEIARGLTAVGAAIPFTGIVKKMLGPAADEVAEMLRDRVRLYRYGNQIRCIEKAEKMAEAAGFTPKAVPPKILFPLLEGASFEENEDLHSMWAALLANAASGMGQTVRPSFISLLRGMAPDEAHILFSIQIGMERAIQLVDRIGAELLGGSVFVKANEAFLVAKVEAPPIREMVRKEFPRIEGEKSGDEDMRFSSCLQGLESAGLIGVFPNGDDNESLVRVADFYLTERGHDFLRSCSPPKPKT